MTDAKLTVRQRRFVAEFLACGNATEAARRAGYSERTARSKGYSLLRLAPVRAEIDRQESDRLAELRVTADRLDAAAAEIAFSGTAEDHDRLRAIRLLYDRQGLLEQRHHLVTQTAARVVIQLPHNGRDDALMGDKLDWESLLSIPKGEAGGGGK